MTDAVREALCAALVQIDAGEDAESDSVETRDALRSLARTIGEWQLGDDPVGLVQQVRDVGALRIFFRDHLQTMFENNSTDPRITKVISAVCTFPPDRFPPDVVMLCLQMLDQSGIPPSAYQLQAMSLALLWHSADGSIEHAAEVSGKTRSLLGDAKLTWIEVVNVIDRFLESVDRPSVRRTYLNSLISRILEYQQPATVYQCIRCTGSTLSGAQLNPLLRILAEAGEVNWLVDVLYGSLAKRPLNDKLGNAILHGLILTDQGVGPATSLLDLKSLLRALATHSTESGPEGLIELRTLETFLDSVASKSPHLASALVLYLADVQVCNSDARPLISDRIVAIGVVASAADSNSVSEMQKIAALANDDRLGRPGLSLPEMTLLAQKKQVGLANIVTALQVTLLGPESLNRGIAPQSEPAVSWNLNQADKFFSALANFADEKQEYGQLSRALDIGLAANALKARTATATLKHFPESNFNSLAVTRLGASSETRTLTGEQLADAVAAARAGAAHELGQYKSARLILSRAPVGPASLGIRLRLLTSESRDGWKALISLLKELLCVPPGQRIQDQLALTAGDQQPKEQSVEARNYSVEEQALCEALSKRFVRTRNWQGLAELTVELGFSPVSRRDPETEGLDLFSARDHDAPIWLIEDWLHLLDAFKQNSRATNLVARRYREEYGRVGRPRADNNHRTDRLTQFGAVLCARYAREGGGFSRIKNVIRECKPLTTRRQSPALANMYEQLLVATKKPDRRRRFEHEVEPELRKLRMPPTAGIWMTVILGAYSMHIKAGEEQLLAALKSLATSESQRRLTQDDAFFSVNETVALASVYARKLKSPSLEETAERLPSLSRTRIETFALALRAIATEYANLGNLDGLERLRQALAMTETTTQSAESSGLKEVLSYIHQIRIVAIAEFARDSSVMLPAARQIFSEIIDGRLEILDWREVDSLAELLTYATSGSDEDLSIRTLDAAVTSSSPNLARRLLTRCGLIAVETRSPRSWIHVAVRQVADGREISLPRPLLEAFDASTLDEAKQAVGEVAKGLSVEGVGDAVMSVAQFRVFSRLLHHELQGPARTLSTLFSGLSYWISMVREGGPSISVDELEDWLSDVKRGAEKLQLVSSQFAESVSATRNSTAAVAVTQQVANRVGGRILVVDRTPATSTITVDIPEATLALVLATLIENALGASNDDTVSITCSLTPPTAADIGNRLGWLVISISNTGLTVPDEIIDRINEGRWVNDPAQGGVGSSLADVNIRFAGGWTRVAPRADGGGTDFVIALPLSNKEN